MFTIIMFCVSCSAEQQAVTCPDYTESTPKVAAYYFFPCDEIIVYEA